MDSVTGTRNVWQLLCENRTLCRSTVKNLMHNGNGLANAVPVHIHIYQCCLFPNMTCLWSPLPHPSASLSNPLCHHLQSKHPSIPCLVFIISPSACWFPFTLPWPRCLNASLHALLSVHLRTCSAFPSFPNANLLLLLSCHSLSPFSVSGELYDLDAASLQLKVINYVSGWDHSYTPTKTHTYK